MPLHLPVYQFIQFGQYIFSVCQLSVEAVQSLIPAALHDRQLEEQRKQGHVIYWTLKINKYIKRFL